jgi:hypothetical protein
MPGREGAKLVINQWHQLRRRRSPVAILEPDKKFCDLIACHAVSPDYRSYPQDDKHRKNAKYNSPSLASGR